MNAAPSRTRAALRRWWSGLWVLASPSLWVLGTTLLLVLALGAVLNWLLRHEAGTAWLVARLPAVQVEGLQGTLLGERWQARRVRVSLKGGLRAVVIDGLDAQGVRWSWDTTQTRWLGLQFARLSAQQVVLEVVATGKPPPPPPRSLALPLSVAARQFEIGTLRIGTLPAFEKLSAAVALELGDEAFRIEELRADWERVRLRGDLRLGSRAPLAFSGQALLQSRHDEAWSGELRIDGTLARMAYAATLRAAPGARSNAATEPPQADVSLTLEPFARWPLAALSGRTRALDLAALSQRLPRTRLAAEVAIGSTAADQPFSATVQVENSAPGRWDEQRLPLRRAELVARASLAQRDQVQIERFEGQLASGAGEAGRISARGRWLGPLLELEAQLADVQPHRLDQRAPRLVASGPVALQWRGVAPPGAAASAPAAPGRPAAATPAAEPAAMSIDIRSRLEGRLEGAPQAVAATLEGRWSPQQVHLRRLSASAGAAVLEAEALLQPRTATRRGESPGWALKTQGTLTEFDPRLWWPGAEGSAWRSASHRFNGGWQLDLLAPAPPAVAPRAGTLASVWLPWLQRLQGNGQLRLRDSQLAGVPVAADLTLAHRDASATLDGEVAVGGNRLLLQGQGQPEGDGHSDRWRAQLAAERLATLAPLVRLLPELAAWAPREGRADLTLQADGRWPALRVGGDLALDRVQLGELQLARAEARWRFDTARDQSLDVQLTLAELALGRAREASGASGGTSGAREAPMQRIARLRATLQGTLREHQIQLDAALPLGPPSWAVGLLGVSRSDGTRARLVGDGVWTPDGAGGGSWRGRVQRLRAQAWSARTPDAEPSVPPWLETQDLRAELRFTANGGLDEVRAEAGVIRLADSLTLRSEAFQIDMRQSTPDFALRAQIEPFAAAPLLARWQPGIGWGGDLQLAASLDLKAAARFDAEVSFERRSGDLFIEDTLGRQPLGLSALRLALSAHEGRWRFTPRIVGQSLGEIGGELSLATRPEQRWPAESAPLTGMVEARVANLGVWSNWVPPGWRLVGGLNTRFTLGGTLGAPEYTGVLEGQGLGVRNPLQGVDVRDGEVRISLRGDRAQVERFVLKGGEGQLSLEGGASFGAAPLARLQLKAERFRVLGRVDRRLIASGAAALELGRERLKLDGSLKVDEGLFDLTRRDAPSLDEDVSIRGAVAKESPGDNADGAEPVAPVRSLWRNSQVALAIDLGDKLAIRGRGLETQLEGQLRFSTPQGQPQVHGIVRTVDGTYTGYGQKLEIDHGQLAYSGPPGNPALDILALRPNLDVRVGVAIVGTLVNPRVRLYSDPEMSEADKLSWLVLGRPSDGLGRADTALLQRAAVALLAGEGEAPTETFLRRIGLDDLSFKQSDGEVRETVVTLGKQLSRRWYLGYERGVNATSGTWQLIYRIAQRFTLRAQGGDENSLDLIWVWRRGEQAVPQKP